MFALNHSQITIKAETAERAEKTTSLTVVVQSVRATAQRANITGRKEIT
jgi:hypothetical protein